MGRQVSKLLKYNSIYYEANEELQEDYNNAHKYADILESEVCAANERAAAAEAAADAFRRQSAFDQHRALAAEAAEALAVEAAQSRI